MERLRLTLTPRIAPALVDQLIASLSGATGVVTLEGAGAGTFCLGLDGAWAMRASADEARALFRRYALLCEAVAATPGPSVALVDGAAAGGGLALAAAADLVIATPGSSFALPEVLVGLVPAVAFPWVARRAGAMRARRLAMSAASITAAEALAIGLVDEIAADLEKAAAGYIRRWSRADPRALTQLKRIASTYDLGDAIERIGSLLASPETRARIALAEAGEAPWPRDDDE